MVNIKVLRDFIAVQEMQDSEKEQSIIKIVRLNDDRLRRGTVVAVGTGVLTANGQSHKIEVEVGEKVLFDRTNAIEVVHENQKYWILNELSVRCVLL